MAMAQREVKKLDDDDHNLLIRRDEVVCFLACCGSNDQGQLGWIPEHLPMERGTPRSICSHFATLDWSVFNEFPENCGETEIMHKGDTSKGEGPSVPQHNVIGTTIALNAGSERMLDNSAIISCISCGDSHTMCCWSDGTLYAWGSNSFGQLGVTNNTEGNIFRPTRVRIPDPHPLCARDAKVDACAEPRRRHQGNENSDDFIHSMSSVSRPLSPLIVRIVACGSFHTLMVTSVGSLFACGKDTDGCLGLGSLADRSVPTHVTTFVSRLQTLNSASSADSIDGDAAPADHPCSSSMGNSNPIIVGAAAGFAHSLVLTETGSVYSFGRGVEGQLGDGKFGCISHTNSASTISSLVHLATAFDLESDEENQSFLSAPEDSKKVIGKERDATERKATVVDTELNCDEDAVPHRSLVPLLVTGPLADNPVVMISCSKGGHGSFAVTARDGFGWRWGLLNRETTIKMSGAKRSLVEHVVPSPTPLPPPLGVAPSVDFFPNDNRNQETPTASNINNLAAQRLNRNTSQAKNDRIVSISAGAHHLICVTRSGEAWAMGGPGPYLGLGPGCKLEWLHAPGRVLLPGDILINGVTCGENHTLLSTSCGKVFACGEASAGQLGIRVDGSQAADQTCSAEIAVPKEVSVRAAIRAAERKTNEKKRGDNTVSKKAVKASFVGEYSFGRDSVFSYLQRTHDAAAQIRTSLVVPQSDLDSFEDDEDYWGDDGLGYDLEMDFGSSKGAPYGGPRDEASSSLSSLKRLTSETRRHICNSTLAVSGAIISGGQKISGIVSAVASGLQASSGDLNPDNSMQAKADEVERHGDAVKLRRSESHQDSFDGLMGNSKRTIVMSAGKNFSILHMADKPDY